MDLPRCLRFGRYLGNSGHQRTSLSVLVLAGLPARLPNWWAQHSLILPDISLFHYKKFPVPLCREFGWKYPNSLA
jgi:hypothetical protein